MKYLLDTCVISDFVKGHPATLDKIKSTPPSKFATTSISLMEIYYGLDRNPKIAKKIEPIIKDFINSIHVFQFDSDTATYAAKARSYLHQNGTPIGAYDILIGGTALQHQLTLITSNEKEFQRIPKLLIENWRS